MKSRLADLAGFTRFIGGRMVENRCLQVAGSLSFTTLLALVPFITIALAVLAPFDVFNGVGNQFKAFLLSNLVPDTASRIITVYMRQFTDNAERLTVMGIIVLALTAIMMISTVDKAFTAIWQIKHQRPLWQRLMLYWTILTVMPMVIGLTMTMVNDLFNLLPDLKRSLNWVEDILTWLLRTVMAIISFVLLFRFAPNRQVPWKHTLIGGTFTGIAFELMRLGFHFYVKKLASYKLVYGAFASLPIFLAWLYLLWSLLLVGATITASLSYWHGHAWKLRQSPGRDLYDALRILGHMDDAHQIARDVTPEELHKKLHVGLGDVLNMLSKLETHGWVKRLAHNKGWILGQDLDKVMLLDLYRVLIWDTRMLDPVLLRHDALAEALRVPVSRLEAELVRPVSSLTRDPELQKPTILDNVSDPIVQT